MSLRTHAAFFTAIAATIVVATPTLSHSIRTITSNKTAAWEASAQYIHFNGGGSVAALANRNLERDAQKAIDSFLKEAADQFKDTPKPDTELAFEEKAKLVLANTNLISVYGDGYENFGGAHPSQYYSSHAFGLVHGKAKQLKIKDLFLPGTSVAAVVSRRVLPKLRAKHASGVDDPTIHVLEESSLETFTISKSGITFLFGDGEMGSHAEGAFVVKLPFSSFKGKLDPNGPLKPVL